MSYGFRPAAPRDREAVFAFCATTWPNGDYIPRVWDAWLADPEGPPSFEKLNRRVYDELFLTPATDPWLGMSVEGTFTGLPGDGIARQ